MKILPPLIYAASALALCGFGLSPSTASTEKLLYSFPANSFPEGRLTQDNGGSLYSTAEQLGGYGAVYRLKQKDGVWREATLLDFNNTDGANPIAGPLIDKSTGVLYGTTQSGGSSGGYGTVYNLAPAGRAWTETVLHSFSGADGAYPQGVLLKDKTTGYLFGTSVGGGKYSCGTAFQVAESNGTWMFTTIYTFQGGNDSCGPVAQLKPTARAGTLIGADTNGYGQIFQLEQSQGVWNNSIVYRFSGGRDGQFPVDLDTSSDGTIYGVTQFGGQYGHGVVFKLSPNNYIYSLLYAFRGGSDGSNGTGINLDSATGNLYGTTYDGGTANAGTVFRLAPNGNSWTETILHSFNGGPKDGANPQSRPIVDRTTGVLYGTTQSGGKNNGGTVYMVQP